MARKKQKLNSLDSQKWAASHQRSVDAVLTPAGHTRVPVTSKGSQFYNRAAWTGRAFLSAMCEWLRINRNQKPTEADVRFWVNYANHSLYSVVEEIVIATTPKELEKGTALALVGGAYHEALHSIFSCKRELTAGEIIVPFFERFDLVENWSRLTGPLLMWSNIIEDIRIERRGIEKFPGMRKKLEELQDFVLNMETKSRDANANNPLGHRATSSKNEELSVICGTFRDLGLGYKTPLAQKTLAGYKARSEEAFNFVVKGDLKPFLKKAINLSAEDDMGCIWLAMDIVAALINANKNAQDDKPQDDGTMSNPPENDQPPREVDQADAYGDEEDGSGGEKVTSKKPPIFKVGDRAKMKVGPHRGKTVVITYAGLPDRETGVQELEMELALDEG